MPDEEKHTSSNEEQAQFTSDADINKLTTTPEEEKKLVRKLDRRILPITCLLYLFACGSFVSPSQLTDLVLIVNQILTVRTLEMRAFRDSCRRTFMATLLVNCSIGSTPPSSFRT